MRSILLALLSVVALHAATSFVISPTATQAKLRIHTDQVGACTVQASEGSTIGTLVYDVDTTRFPGSNSDTRAGSIVGFDHVFILGTRTAAKASDGKWYSRALQAYTLHTAQVTCGLDTVTQQFSTGNPPLGSIAGETIPFDPLAPYNAAFPSVDMTVTTAGNDTGQAWRAIDPLTGFQMVRITGPMQGAGIINLNGGVPPTAFDPASAWTTPLNAVGTSSFATIGSAGAASALFIPFGFSELINYQAYGEWSATSQIDDMNLSMNTSGSSGTPADRVMMACVSLHHGAACDTDTITISNVPQTTASVVSFPNTTNARLWNPMWKLWTSASPYPAPVDLGTRTGTATMSGTTITWVSGALFSNRLIAGDRINLLGSGCSNGGAGYCTVASVTDSKHITTVESHTVGAAAAFFVQNAGLKIWKNNGSGTVSINTVLWYAGVGLGYGGTANEQKDLCSPNSFTLTVNRDGSTRTTNAPARLCQFEAGNGQLAAYVWVPSTGEAWHIANGATTYPGPGPGAAAFDYMGTGGRCAGPMEGPVWHPTDPFTWYCETNSGTGPTYQVVLKFTYAYVAGSGSCNGREWNDYTYGSVPENPCVAAGIHNETPASLGQDLGTQLHTLDPSFDATYFSVITSPGGFGKYIALSFAAGFQNTIAYFAWYDTTTKTVVKSADSFRTFPMRWGQSHGNLLVHNSNSAWSLVSVNAFSYYRSGNVGSDLSEMSIVSITGKSGTDLPSNYFTACPGGLDARWVALGAVGMNCVQMTMTGEPYLANPSAADKAKWPASPLNAAWSQIQTLAEGDSIMDLGLNTFNERLLVVKKTAGTGNQIIVDFLRGPQWPNMSTCAVPSSHSSAWIPVLVPSGSCLGGNDYWVNVGGSAPTVPEDWAIGGAHIDSSGLGPGGGLTGGSSAGAAYTSVRMGAIPGSLYQPGVSAGSPSYTTERNNPAFNASDPSAGSFIIQSHPSSRQVLAPMSEQGWFIDAYPYGGAFGNTFSPICTIGSMTLQAGTTSVYKLVLGGGTCPSVLDMKNFPLEVTAGRFILADISSPALGNVVTDSTPYRWCRANVINECRSPSAVGDIYATIPFGETGIACSYGAWDINTPCLFTKYGMVGNVVQATVTQRDLFASGTRKLGYGLTVPTHTSDYWSGTSDPDGKWAFFTPVFADNMLVNQYFAYKLTPTPTLDSVARNQYGAYQISLAGIAGDQVRVRFGYAEYGPVDGSANSLYCMSRAESCYSTATPTSANNFLFASETQVYTACATTCQVTVPALPNHILYYTVERKNGSQVTVSALQATPIK